MSTFTYTVSPDVFDDHPDYRRGVVVFRNLDNTRPNAELTALLRATEQALRERVTGNPADYPQIAAWREAYRRFGAKPSEHRSAIEALTRRVLKPDNLPDINPLVDIGNLLSLRYVLPAGVHPIGPQSKAIELRKTLAADRFLVDAAAEPETIAPGEIVLAAGTRVLTRRWTWRQAADTRTLADTRCVFFDIDGLPPTTAEDVRSAMADLVELVARYCGGECVGHAVLHAEQPTLTLSLD
ncbi:B3/4 domain-containing protein [Pseudomonas sp. 5P_5.1_Bac1]|uniref:B3/B4 domain-containing protein n=1 Tax=Pseudomonas sp. 5P_5.1_Bac1 TaxID=2971616 RepID=UPI0021C6671B|nr:phenylalanine--tRNA ligase beta subunit-related protein [Pseudomonas sp. 5P_5.1_Bac1]MCU1722802.1 phenylalanine--tRNA ligase beta subunit-related protein [Pseudomonas sp. 5P_5.1_Bac1]